MFNIAIQHHCQPKALLRVEKDMSSFFFFCPVFLYSLEVSIKAVLLLAQPAVI